MLGINTDMSASDDHLSRLDTAEGKIYMGLIIHQQRFSQLRCKKKIEQQQQPFLQKPNLEHSRIVGSLEKCNITFAWDIRRRTNEAEEIPKLMTAHQTD